MAFDNTVLTAHADLMAGEVLKSKPHNVEAFELFSDGLYEAVSADMISPTTQSKT